MDIAADDVLRIIIQRLDLVQLHVLYCSSKRLSYLVEQMLRTAYLDYAMEVRTNIDSLPAMSDFERTMIKVGSEALLYSARRNYTPCSLLISFSSEFICNRFTTLGTWVDDFFVDITPALIDWYGQHLIQQMTKIWDSGYKGLQQLIRHDNGHHDDEILTIMRLILEKGIVPMGLCPQPCPDDGRLIATLVYSGRVKVLQSMCVNWQTVSLDKVLIADLAIRSDSLSMLEHVCQVTGPTKWTDRQVIIALKTGDTILQRVLAGEMSKFVDPLDNPEDILISGRLERRIFYRLFRDDDLEAPMLDRALKFFTISADDLLRTFCDAWTRDNEELVIIWLKKHSILTQDTMITGLRPFMNDINWYMHNSENPKDSKENCKCDKHSLRRTLIRHGFTDVDVEESQGSGADSDDICPTGGGDDWDSRSSHESD